ncbi:MAG: zinc metallopeptidase [Fibrobacter sp.]|nr:zinc metallopeptidase [Fibrobacter sp.]
MFLDPIYMLIILVAAGSSAIVAAMVKKRFRAASKIRIQSGLTGKQVAESILRASDISDVKVVRHQGFLSDHYNPMTKTLALSPDVYDGISAASAGVAAHEVGHAIQHAENYFPMWLRSAIVPAANIGSNLGPWLVIIGMFLGVAGGLGYTVAMLGVALFAAATLFTVVTVPVEYDASSRAKNKLLSMGIVNEGPEFKAVAGVLSAAGLTYVAAAANSIMMLLYWAARAGLLGGNRD